MRKLVIILGILLVTFSSCNKNKIYEKRLEFENYTWNRLKPLFFDISISDIKSEYNIYFTLRHITQYPYDKLKINLTITSPSGDERTTVHNFIVKDADGKFTGEGTGDLWDIKLLVKGNISFNKPGVYKIQIDNLMDYFDVVGLVDFGVIVEKTKLKKDD